jgi:2-polyprenyl-3-methyl-5-hydroxy-6-metoxy-1,4-benzoquinol methylase
MSGRWMPGAFGLLAGLIVGCAGGGSSTPMATEGPNQVVIKIPDMT